jgi:hypothetical protein
VVEGRVRMKSGVEQSKGGGRKGEVDKVNVLTKLQPDPCTTSDDKHDKRSIQ